MSIVWRDRQCTPDVTGPPDRPDTASTLESGSGAWSIALRDRSTPDDRRFRNRRHVFALGVRAVSARSRWSAAVGATDSRRR
jgi:hypothetical protein